MSDVKSFHIFVSLIPSQVLSDFAQEFQLLLFNGLLNFIANFAEEFQFLLFNVLLNFIANLYGISRMIFYYGSSTFTYSWPVCKFWWIHFLCWPLDSILSHFTDCLNSSEGNHQFILFSFSFFLYSNKKFFFLSLEISDKSVARVSVL